MRPGDTPLLGCNVIVVEDEYYLADDIARALGALGARIMGPVAAAAEAFAILDAPEPVHLAVLDINLQDGKVFSLADALAERGVPFVFATGYDARQLPPRHAHVMLWEKPFEAAHLAAALPNLKQGAVSR